MHENKTHRLIGIAGVIGVLAFALLWFMAAVEDSNWIFGVDMLSSLGISVAGNAAIFFNLACIISGLFIMVSGMGIAILTKRVYSAAGVAIAFGGMFLSLVGLFPEDLATMHNFVAGTMFLLFAIAMILMTIGDWQEDRVFFGGLAMMFLTIIVGCILTQELAFTEAVATILIMLWFGMNSVKITVRQSIKS